MILLFGGNSFEHEISVVSAITLKKEYFKDAKFVFLDSDSNLFLIPNDKMNSKHFSSKAYENDARLEFISGGFRKNKMFGSEKISGIVLNLIHGKSGEDGQMAGILDFYNIDFVGPRLESSAISFNKELTKSFAISRGVKILDFITLKKGESFESILKKLREMGKSELILKPARLGSSIGISILKDLNSEREIQYALDTGFELDNELIVEPFINNIEEYNLAGCAINGDFRFSNIERVQKTEFLDFDKKYLDFSARGANKRADIDEKLGEKIKDSFRAIYQNAFEGAIIRCDFFAINNEVFLNEINPIPGSMAHYLFDDFFAVFSELSRNLPKKETLKINYKYISRIQAHKGK